MDFELRERTVLLTLGGSRAYGLQTLDSDVDVKGVVVPPKAYFLGFVKRFEQADAPAELIPFLDDLPADLRRIAERTKLEGSVYHLVKFVALAAECNPNILDVLFCREDDVLRSTAIGRRLRGARDLFLSAKAKHTFSGYAASQLKRIRTHRRWLLNPPTRPPTRADFGLPEHALVPREHLLAAEAAIRAKIDGWNLDLGALDEASRIQVQGAIARYVAELAAGLGLDREGAEWLAAARHVGLDDPLVEVLRREKAYRAARAEWQRHRAWMASRNPARAALEARYGYDTKHGAHLVRLYTMGREILETGRVHVWRGPGGPDDRDRLLAVRAGAWSYDELVDWAERQQAELDALYRRGRYAVPREPDRERIDRLCVELVDEALTRGIAP